MAEGKDYVGLCEHGKMRAWCAGEDGDRAWAKEVAKSVADMIRSGWTVERVTTDEMRKLDHKCPECEAAKAGKRAKKVKASQ